MRRDVLVLPLDNVTAFHFNGSWLEFHIPHDHVDNCWRARVWRTGSGPRRVSVCSHRLDAGLGWCASRTCTLARKVDPITRREKSQGENYQAANNQYPQRERLNCYRRVDHPTDPAGDFAAGKDDLLPPRVSLTAIYFVSDCWRCFACSRWDVKIGPALSRRLFSSAFFVFGIRVFVTTPMTASW